MLQKISSRQHQILDLLMKNRTGLSIDEIANALDISRTAVQQHFVAIENESYIKKNTLNKTAGRPVTIYVITDKGINYFPKQYAWFSELILSDLQDEISPERFRGYMQRLGIRLAEKLRDRFEGKNLEKRLEELLVIMTDLGYQVETTDNGDPDHIHMQAHNCVYHDLAQQHQEICQFDIALMSNLLDRNVELLTCMAKGDCTCRFNIKK
ncbi:HTH domain-containing protein [Methylomarinum sp. Ch1-1]|uniref:HTH domain-containing protein n=1 Tax=Methylomarinum roseum TaxID=3067653 RepID=A0AAU7NQR0_9GAMM|nr:HTH domain-containing protein [Methylomarinum sp. Ch1-1]MDP4520750.1 HTH domain-containing protein [Methylomarinum sp. Ch1-1]